MNIFNKVLLTSLISSSILLTACSDKKNNTEQSKSSEQSTSTQGNWQAKSSELSSANTNDIKSDLTQLNKITNSANSKGLALREEAQNAANDPAKVKDVLAKSQAIQKELQQEIMGLNLKSAEVQNIRTQMIDNLLTSEKLYELSTAANFNLSAPTPEFTQLSQRSMAIQQKIGTELNELNSKYAQ